MKLRACLHWSPLRLGLGWLNCAWHCLTRTHTHTRFFGVKYAQVAAASGGSSGFGLHWNSWHSLFPDLHTSPVWPHMALSLKHTRTHTHPEFTDTLIWDAIRQGIINQFGLTHTHMHRHTCSGSHGTHMAARNVWKASECWWWEDSDWRLRLRSHGKRKGKNEAGTGRRDVCVCVF